MSQTDSCRTPGLERDASRAGLRAEASAPRTPTEVPTGTPQELPPGRPDELPSQTPTELPPGTPPEMPQEMPPDLPPEPPVETPPDRSGAASARPAAVEVERHLTVLLVEDDALIRQSTADMLEELGHRVVEAGRAAQALKSLGERAVDLLLCDVSLPDESGVELARRARLLHPMLPIVFATGHSAIDGLAEAGLAGSSLLLSKPFEQDALADSLTRAIAGA